MGPGGLGSGIAAGTWEGTAVSRRRRTTSLVALISVAGALSLTLAQSSAASGSPSPRPTALRTPVARADLAVKGVHYARISPVCGPPKPGDFACFAMLRTPV